MRDFLPADVRKREYVIGIIKSVYESYGFEPLETPAVENIETLTGKYGEEGNQLIYKILKRGEKLNQELARIADQGRKPEFPPLDWLADLALRYDLTVPLARVVANNKNELPKFFKRYQIQPVWRADRPARGRFREFYQCDVDVIGSGSMVVEAEVILAVSKILEQLGFEDFTIRINHRTVLSGLLEHAGIEPPKFSEALTALDKLDKVGFEGVVSELRSKGINDHSARRFLEFNTMLSDAIAVPANIRIWNAAMINYVKKDFQHILFPQYHEGLRCLEDIVKLTDRNDGNCRVKIDLSLARGLSYYTGTIMEINVTDLAGSLGGGGRYDGLIGMFGKEQIPACGFSLGLERILVVMEERGMFPPEIADSTPADVMVTIFSDETVADSLMLASDLRAQNLRVTVYPQADKNDKQFKYASQIGVPFLCDLTDENIQSGTVLVKNMTTREKTTVPREKVAETILKSVRVADK